MGHMIVCDSIFLGVVFTSGLFSCDKSLSSLVDETPGRGLTMIENVLEDLALGRKGAFRESFSLYLLSFKYLQLKMISIPKWHILAWRVIHSHSHILE